MKETDDVRIHKVLKAAAVAEIQAIAIYDAECFWIRERDRLAVLRRIRAEEVEHGGFISGWVQVPGWEKIMNRAMGRVLGTALACLPWRTLCRVQAWAEEQASAIYLQAVQELDTSMGSDQRPGLLEGLREASRSEARHAAEFRALGTQFRA